ncbi:helix-turn-helix transcriptional regulator [Halioxenophilus sp. WMMB6]|uniref:helix-turn-helix domain-containing protein n=1 Tax=Halioxenophilus sp. WMMB6 TaxID=3073815 RepID=UPI00295E4DA4|nr:helix-turn-helix transcriptional regulator [Halioxenophilus sp. WMMB6]
MDFDHVSDQIVLEALGQRFKAARLNRDLSVAELASKAGLTGKTISNLEKGKKSVGLLNIIAVLRALDMLAELEGFIPEPPPRAAAIVRQQNIKGKTRQRASKKSRSTTAGDNDSAWTWGEE